MGHVAKNIIRIAIVALICAMPLLALAQSPVFPFVGVEGSQPTTQIDGLGTDAPRSTGCISVRGWRYLNLIHLADHGVSSPTLSAVTTTCKAYLTSDCSDAIPQSIPLCIDNSCSDYAPRTTLAADKGWRYKIDVAGDYYIKCALTFENGKSTDLITVKSTKTRE